MSLLPDLMFYICSLIWDHTRKANQRMEAGPEAPLTLFIIKAQRYVDRIKGNIRAYQEAESRRAQQAQDNPEPARDHNAHGTLIPDPPPPKRAPAPSKRPPATSRAQTPSTPADRTPPADHPPRAVPEPVGERHTRRIPQDVKIAVSARDHGRCRQCGSTEKLHFDHVIPASKGGANTMANIQLLCGRCNRAKAAKLTARTLPHPIAGTPGHAYGAAVPR